MMNLLLAATSLYVFSAMTFGAVLGLPKIPGHFGIVLAYRNYQPISEKRRDEFQQLLLGRHDSYPGSCLRALTSTGYTFELREFVMEESPPDERTGEFIVFMVARGKEVDGKVSTLSGCAKGYCVYDRKFPAEFRIYGLNAGTFDSFINWGFVDSNFDVEKALIDWPTPNGENSFHTSENAFLLRAQLEQTLRKLGRNFRAVSVASISVPSSDEHGHIKYQLLVDSPGSAHESLKAEFPVFKGMSLTHVDQGNPPPDSNEENKILQATRLRSKLDVKLYALWYRLWAGLPAGTITHVNSEQVRVTESIGWETPYSVAIEFADPKEATRLGLPVNLGGKHEGIHTFRKITDLANDTGILRVERNDNAARPAVPSDGI